VLREVSPLPPVGLTYYPLARKIFLLKRENSGMLYVQPEKSPSIEGGGLEGSDVFLEEVAV